MNDLTLQDYEILCEALMRLYNSRLNKENKRKVRITCDRFIGSRLKNKDGKIIIDTAIKE